MYFLDEFMAWFPDFQYKPLLYIYAAMGFCICLYIGIRHVVVSVKVNKHRKKLENVITKKFKTRK
jgi:hypothetical protein